MLALLVGISLAGAPGCKKAGNEPSMAPVEVNGVKVDMPKLQQVMASASDPQAQAYARDAASAFRYKDFVSTLMQLDKLVNAPGLTEEQKKVAGQVLNQVKQLVAQTPSPSKPAGQ